MKTTVREINEIEIAGKGIVSFICNNIYKIISSGQSQGFAPLDSLQVGRDDQFTAYVNNRMNILLMWVQQINKKDLTDAKLHTKFFLHDMEHHFVDSYVEKRIRDAFRWLKAYVKVYPNKFDDRSSRALEMIALVYEGLGIPFKMASSQHDFVTACETAESKKDEQN